MFKSISALPSMLAVKGNVQLSKSIVTQAFVIAQSLWMAK
uniref:Uncharacterized protein n=1 Tax=Rhizophora mucronata TaxID=61149 RepID=A0A2P2QXD8_RHIMU